MLFRSLRTAKISLDIRHAAGGISARRRHIQPPLRRIYIADIAERALIWGGPAFARADPGSYAFDRGLHRGCWAVHAPAGV